MLGIAGTLQVAGLTNAAAAGAGAFAPPGCAFTAPASVVCRYAFTGGEQIFYTAPNVPFVDVELTGAAGGSVAYSAVPAGLGGTIRRRIRLRADTTRLLVEVGGPARSNGCQADTFCQGGFNGGGSSVHGGGGGGATDVRTLPASDPGTLASRLAVAGGGGGVGAAVSIPAYGPSGAGGNAGAAGGTPGSGPATGGGAGGASAGGEGGITSGEPGRPGLGGGGGLGLGGGGGGGWFGGGGGGWAGYAPPSYTFQYPQGGGGGGSSYGDSAGLATAGTRPSATIRYTLPGAGQLRQAATTTGTGRCATVPASAPWAGTPLVLQPCALNATDPLWIRQQFKLAGRASRGVFLANSKWGGCLDTAGAGIANDTAVVLSPCGASSSQTWHLAVTAQDTWQLTQQASQRSLDTRNGQAGIGSVLVIGNATGSLTQQWSAVAQ